MITFETQEDFENAVMDVIRYRLGLNVFDSCGEVTVQLYDTNRVKQYSDGVMHEAST